MRKWNIYAGIGVLVLAAALAIPALAQRGRGGPGPSMMGFGWGNQTTTSVTSIDAAAALVRDALAASGYSDLVVAEVMEFSNQFYVLVKEQRTSMGAVELLVERGGVVHPEYGPNMMWNTKYGHMAGVGGRRMMGGYSGTPSTQPMDKDRAKGRAAEYLAQAFPGTTPDEGTTFYGYFTFDVEQGAASAGMLSVNAYSGQVWYHTWHGTFVQEKGF